MSRSRSAWRVLPWLALVALAVAVLAVGTLGGCGGGVVSSSKHRQTIKLHRLGSASVRPDEPVTILVLGSDRRSNEAVNESRADAIMLVRMNPRTRRSMMLSFPRDSYLQIPGHGQDKINSALSLGGPKLVARTISEYSGIKIDYYTITDFGRFGKMVGKLGGVQMTLRTSVVDSFAGASLSAGRQRLSPGESLAFCRSRHVGNGDFSRAARQQQFLRAVFNQETRQRNPFRMLRLVKIFADETDTDLSARELVDLARIVFTLRADRVRMKVLEGEGVMQGSASVVRLDEEQADKDFTAFKRI